MPRNGDGSSDNAIEAGHNMIKGAGPAESTRVARADKTAPTPEHEKGAGLEGMNASGGQSQGLSQGPNRGQGKGPLSTE
ncbi:hypothetical protein QBC42DRAFT_11807 [Cladorrhinum samala]|uniref:Uncharacterized protein n=1 Tax=Cladorrhinum samala TaxID=585594 RepID=A0AAV9HEB0_9PEZI|nr:hypothetical protein QBC42DRAFT_11807 [Cladorrhinum samala]